MGGGGSRCNREETTVSRERREVREGECWMVGRRRGGGWRWAVRGIGLMKGELESHYSELILLNEEKMKLIQCMCEWMVTLRTHIDSVRKM